MEAALAIPQHLHPRPYIPRRPQEGVLFKTISKHWDSFHAELTAQGQNIPRHVEREFEAFLRCGIIQHGFVRLACKDCQSGMLVGRSCKCRGFCPSCGGRRMNQTAMLLVEDVLPSNVSYRQFVLTFPIALRYMMAARKKLMNQIIKITHASLLEFYKEEAKAHHIKEPEAGGINFIQFFSSSLSLAPHLHVVMLDGTYFRKGGGYDLEFRERGFVSDDDVAKLMFTITERVDAHLKKHNIPVGEMAPDEDHDFENAMLQTSGASIVRRIAFGQRKGSKVRTDGTLKTNWVPPDPNVMTFKGKRCVMYRGFSLHANTTVDRENPKGLEKLLKYVCRPPLSFDRLSYVDPNDPDGDLKFALKSRWDDGSEHVIFSPKELIEKIFAIIPPRYFNLIRHVGILGSNHYLRPRIVKKRKRRFREGLPSNPKKYGKVRKKADQDTDHQQLQHQQSQKKTSVYWVPWDELLNRTFQVSPETCVICGGKMVAVDCVLKRDAIEKILTHLKIDPHPPPRGLSYSANLQLVYDAN